MNRSPSAVSTPTARPLHGALGTLDRFWFPALPATRLAALRVVTALFCLGYLTPRVGMFITMAAETDAGLFAPVGVVAFLDTPMSASGFAALVWIMLAANVAFLLGAFHRVTGPLFAATLLWVLCYRNSWSMIYHSDNVLVIHVLILGLARSADAWSFDAWWRTRRGRPAPPATSWSYGWPIMLMCAVTLATYFLAGAAKLYSPLGWEWGNGESLRSQLAVDGLRKELLGDGAAPLTFTLYPYLWLFTAMGIGTLIVEVLAPLALLHRYAGWLWALAAFGLHWGIFLVMDIHFRYQLTGAIYASFFPVEQVARLFHRRAAPALLDAPEMQRT